MSMVGNYIRISDEKLQQLIISLEELPDYLYGEEEDILDIDQTWQAIHYLLTGNAESGSGPLDNVVLGGHPMGSEDDDWEYGPPLYKTVEEVREAYIGLSQISLEDLRKTYDPDKLHAADIYPDVWDDGGIDHLISYLQEILGLFKLAAANNEAIIFWID